eukprot:CAMPEP_0178769280 /NCGR_PEP_ID=MMETSP0744-20121128/20733_1 /TAXON_ID=913974 /ORGANISM="Nitzschia punctata, Strain CCMP561" /LENGTH=276 /DNA_ID=CAMNT_0020425497 /DNA_START=56 /DNA_END=886 /DNA_ORIENTATION=-
MYGLGSSFLLALTLVVSSCTTLSQGQVIGVDICSCTPSAYVFTLDFSLFCPPVNVTVGDAVAGTTCMVSPFGDPTVSDLIPVEVQSIDVLELNQNLQIKKQENIAGNFVDGDTFQYTSYASTVDDEIVDPNALEEVILAVYLITFTNSCASYPVLFEGGSAGWTRFSSLQPPVYEYCPVVPTPEPSSAPTTLSPTFVPTLSPTFPPSLDPTLSPASSSASPSIDFVGENGDDDDDSGIGKKSKKNKGGDDDDGKGKKSKGGDDDDGVYYSGKKSSF